MVLTDISNWNGAIWKPRSESKMPRSKGQNGAVVKVRADLEAVLGALADHDECVPLVELRIKQAIRRAGLNALLDPALEDLQRMVQDVEDARSQVCAVVQRLVE